MSYGYTWSWLLRQPNNSPYMKIIGVMDKERGRFFHNFSHIKRMYQWAHTLNMPYDKNLDLAILFCRIINDQQSDNYGNIEKSKEYFAEWMERRRKFPDLEDVETDTVLELLDSLATYNLEKDRRLIILSLMDYTDVVQVFRNFQYQFREENYESRKNWDVFKMKSNDILRNWPTC